MYLTKKEADEHDKMLDIALELTSFIEKAEHVKIDEDTLEELTIYISKHRDEVIRILRAAKPRKPPAIDPTDKAEEQEAKTEKPEVQAAAPKAKAPVPKGKAAEPRVKAKKGRTRKIKKSS
jgi:dsDNA-binding SOS-regulon protein